jgi:hypothetical protein
MELSTDCMRNELFRLGRNKHNLESEYFFYFPGHKGLTTTNIKILIL